MFKNFYKNKRVLIIGNTGFKGSWLSIWLLRLGAKVYGLSKNVPTKPSIYKSASLDKKVKTYEQRYLFNATIMVSFFVRQN